MNIAPPDISAAARSPSTGGGRLVRALVAGIAVAMLAGVSNGSAAAGWPGGEQRGEQRAEQRGEPRMEAQRERPQAPPQMQRDMPPQREARPFDTRAYDMRLDEARRQQAQQQQDTGRRSGRMTPDERRELRRQINEAGMDLYPNTPRR